MICIRQYSAKLDIFQFLNIAKILTMTTLIENEHTAVRLIQKLPFDPDSDGYPGSLCE
jgi:hypothetical protein